MQNLAGNYSNYAAGQAVIGAGQGMAEHGTGGGIAGAAVQMGVGLNMANQMAGAMNPGGGGVGGQMPQFTPGGAMVTCGKCNTRQPGGKFCAECGTALAQAKKFCTGCGQELGPAAKFCANCGTSANAPAQSPAP